MGCLSNEPANSSNFLRWHRTNGVTFPISGPLPLCYDAIPAGATPYNFSESDVPAYLPVINGDVLRFFFNSAAPIELPVGFAGMGMGLIYRGQPVTNAAAFQSSITTVLYPSPAGTRYRFYGDFTVGILPQGRYNPYLYDVNDPDTPLFIANPIQTVNHEPWQRETTLARFKHPSVLANVDFLETGPSFYQQFRIPFAMLGTKYPTTEDKYTSRNSVTRTTSFTLSRTYELRSDFLDEGNFEAAVLMLAHKTIYLNDKLVRTAAALDVQEYFNEVGLLTVTGRVEDIAFSRILSPC